jgi:ABC-type phosphate/phosphonate transport system substrate-binding protein
MKACHQSLGAIDAYRLGVQIGYEVEAAITRNHQEALEAWRAGKLPTADPPAMSIAVVEVAS